MKKYFLFACILVALPLYAATTYHVSPTGNGNGSKASPWGLQTALNHPSEVQGGDTIWIHGGTYRGFFKSVLTGTASQPIIVRQVIGERAIIDGGNSAQENILTISGNYTWYWGFEVFSSDPVRFTSETGSFPSAGSLGRGVCISTTQDFVTNGNKFINLVLHDGFNGFGGWVPANTEMYGCLLYNNGWTAPDRPHGHDIYVQNDVGGERRFINNIIWGAFENNVQAYGTRYTDDFYFEKNISYAGAGDGRCFLVGGGGLSHNPVLLTNYTYEAAGARNLDLGWDPYGNGVDGAKVTGNYFVGGGIYFYKLTNATVTGNTMVSSFYVPSSIPSSYPSNSYSSSVPNKIFVLPNLYEAGRAHIAVYNGSKASAVNVDLSSVLNSGDAYEIRDAQNFYGSAVTQGVYAGSTVSVPMAKRVAVQPVGLSGVRESSLPEFGAFVVLGSVSGTTPPPPVTPKFRKAFFNMHSVGGVYYDGMSSTTIPAEISKYNSSHGYTGADAVSMTATYSPKPSSLNDNNWYRWANIFEGKDSQSSYADVVKAPITVIKTCYIQQQIMESEPNNTVADLQGYMRRIVAVMKGHPETFFVVWNNHPAPTDGNSSRAVKSAQFSVWMKDVFAKESSFPKNVYVFDVFRLLANGTTGICPPNYGGDGDHPSNEAVAVVDPKFVKETFDAAIAYETGTQDTTPPIVTKPVVSLSISPQSRVGPGPVTLNYSVSNNATSASIDNGVGAVSGSSSKTIQVTVSGTYKLTASNSAGSSTATASVMVTAIPPPPPPADTIFQIGDKVAVVPDDDVNCRTGPSLSASRIKLMPSNTKGTILGGPVVADGYHFYNIQYADGAATLGWSAGEYLVKDSTIVIPPPPITDSTKYVLQGIGIGWKDAVAKFDSVYLAGKASVVVDSVALRIKQVLSPWLKPTF